MNCTHCGSKDCNKNGWYKNNQQRHQRFMCKSCGGTFTVLSMEQDSSTKQEHRPELNDPIVDLHLKGMPINLGVPEKPWFGSFGNTYSNIKVVQFNILYS